MVEHQQAEALVVTVERRPAAALVVMEVRQPVVALVDTVVPQPVVVPVDTVVPLQAEAPVGTVDRWAEAHHTVDPAVVHHTEVQAVDQADMVVPALDPVTVDQQRLLLPKATVVLPHLPVVTAVPLLEDTVDRWAEDLDTRARHEADQRVDEVDASHPWLRWAIERKRRR